MFKILAEHMPPPPDGFVPPAMWGDEDHVRGLFSEAGLEVSSERRMAKMEFEDADSWMQRLESDLGPIVLAKAALEPEGRWDAARADLVALEERTNQATDGSIRAEAEYLLTTVALTG
jgi:hypothetical protein